MNQLMNKINNYHHKASSIYISKQKLKKNVASPTGLFKPNAMSIKINKISNSKEGIIYILNQKDINGRSFDKELQDKKAFIQNLINKEKNKKNKDSDKDSLELESKGEISTNNLTENLYNGENLNNTEHNNHNGVKNLNTNKNGMNFYLNRNIYESGFIKNINSVINSNSRNKEIENMHKKIELNANKIKNNNQEKKNIKLNKNNKKGLNMNKSNNNTAKKGLNLNLGMSENNKNINIAKRKYSNLTENNRLNIGIGGLISLKSKTQNYNNLNIKNYYSNKKIQTDSKKVNDIFNNSYENNKIKNNLFSSKKKLFTNNEQNNQKEKNGNKNNSKKNKKMIGLNNIKFKQKNVLLLTDIFNGKKVMQTNSPKTKNINMLQNFKKQISIDNNKNNCENNLTITQEKESIEEICHTVRIERNKELKEMKQTKDSTNNKSNNNNNKTNLLLKNNILKSKIFKNNNGIKNNNSKENRININKGNLMVPKKKKNSHNNINKINNINPAKSQNKLETSYQEKNKNKNEYYNIPLINKVHIFEIGKTKISKNINNNTENNNLTKNIFNNSDKKISKNNNTENNMNEFTPKKNNLKAEFKNIIKLKENNDKSNKVKKHIENSATPINHKHYLIKNFKEIKENINNNSKNNSNAAGNILKKIKDSLNKSKDIDKEFCEMETPILLNTPKLTERIFDAKLNLFEKIKNMNTNYNSNQIKNKEEISSENSEIMYEEISISSNKNKKEIKKINISNKEKNKLGIKNSIKYLLFLEENCIENIFDFLDMTKINLLCTANKKCFNKFKPVINKKIKNKILRHYKKSQIDYMNKIKLSLMNYSSLSKLSLLLLHKKYVDLLLENNQKYDQEIQKDLTRTFPDNSSFKYGNINYNKLYHLLTVYSLYNPKIGYVQGINFIAAHIIILMEKEKEEKNLMFLDAFLNKFQFYNLIGLDRGDLLKKNLNHLGEQLNKYCPEIVKFLKNSNLSHDIFTTNWMLTLFANSMESKYLFIVWDFLIIFGWKFFIGFIISFLNLFKKEMLDEEQNNLNFLMKNILRNQKFKDKFNFIIDEAFSYFEKEKGNKFNEN